MANVMAILQDIDKCMRCNGCVISCKRTWDMKALNPGVHKVAADQRVIVKSQNRIDNGPFLRYSCWHCPDPPCVKRCPFDALTKEASGAVSVDPTKCDPGGSTADGVVCTYQCQTDCQRGGYPKIGVGSNAYTTAKAWKCTMCHGRAGATLDPAYGNPLPTRATTAEIAAVPEKAHEPSCVYTCPAKAMVYDTRDNIIARLTNPANGYTSWTGDGGMFWGTKKLSAFVMPKADPFVEDHITPMLSGAVQGLSKPSVLVPTLVAGGLFAIMARRQRNASGQGEG